jgi:Ca2+-binding RTX toxin-like protein
MALWGKTDATASIPKFLTDAQKEKAVFVSIDEAQKEVNKAKGLTNAGWWLVEEHTDSAGNPRYKVECLVALSATQLAAGDTLLDDAIVADAEVSVTISSQPGTFWYVGDDTAEFSVTAAASAGSPTYQWLTQAPNGTDEWEVIEGATNATVQYPVTAADYERSFKVIVGSTAGAVKVESDVAKSRED